MRGVTQRITEPVLIFRQQVFTTQHLQPEQHDPLLARYYGRECIPAAAPALATIRAVVGRLV